MMLSQVVDTHMAIRNAFNALHVAHVVKTALNAPCMLNSVDKPIMGLSTQLSEQGITDTRLKSWVPAPART